jgi:hypothetical protein
MRRGEMLEFLDYLSFMQDELREWRRDPPVRTVDDGENPTTALLAPPLVTSPASTTTAAAANTSRSSPPVASSSFSTAPWSSDTAAWPDLGIPSLSASSFSSSSPSYSGLALDDLLPWSPALPTEPAPAVPSSPTL